MEAEHYWRGGKAERRRTTGAAHPTAAPPGFIPTLPTGSSDHGHGTEHLCLVRPRSIGEAEDIAPVLALMASDAARFTPRG